MLEKKIQDILAVLCVFAAIAVISLFLYFWQFAYSSDYALIGLMAKSILTRHEIPHFEWPIFVWRVGYQGILLEVYSTALAFKFLGVSPITLNVAPSLFFVFLMICFYRVVRFSFGKTVGLLSTLLMTVSSPYFLSRVLRTQPNYVEIFFLGMLLIEIYLRWIKAYWIPYDQPWPNDPSLRSKKSPGRHLPYIASLGVLCGFGLYTYGQMVFFIACVMIHFALVQWRLFGVPIQNLKFKRAFDQVRPRRFIALFYTVLSFSGLLFFIGIPSFFTMTREMNLGVVVLKWDAITLLRDGSCLFILAICPFLVKKLLWKNRKKITLSLSLFILFFILGFSPSLFYSYVLGRQTSGKFGIGGDLGAFAEKTTYAYQTALEYLNLNTTSLLNPLIAWWCFFSFLYLLYTIYEGVKSVLTHSAEPEEIFKISPVLFLLPVVLFAYGVSSSSSDLYSGRYTVSVLFSCVIGQALFMQRLFNLKRGQVFKKVAVLGFFILFIHQMSVLYTRFKALPPVYFLEPVADYLKENKIEYGYGDYWLAYAITFLTNEKLVIEPLYSGFCPYYESRVAGAKKIAFIEQVKNLIVSNITDKTLIFREKKFHIEEEKVINDVRILIVRERG